MYSPSGCFDPDDTLLLIPLRMIVKIKQVCCGEGQPRSHAKNTSVERVDTPAAVIAEWAKLLAVPVANLTGAIGRN